MSCLLALLLAAPAVAPSPARVSPSAGSLIAVLEFRNKLAGEERKGVDAGYLADEVRDLLLKALPGARVITRENMLVLLQASGKKLEECEGECEVDTGRRIGADLVVSGEVLRFGESYKLDLKLHQTRDGRLLAGAIASGKSIDELDAGTASAVAQLTAPLKAAPPAAVKSESAPKGPRDHPIMRREEKSGLEFVRVFDGSGHLGCATGDAACQANEKPGRELGIGGFWIGRTEVTAGAYGACAKARACSKKPKGRDSKQTFTCNWHNGRHTHPMNCVTWDEAAQFCKWVGGRLPTAMEWEYAARAGRDVIYPWGNEPPTGARANLCDKNCARALAKGIRTKPALELDDGWPATAPVGSFKSGNNAWGLEDMAGNVAEWTASTLEGTSEKEVRGGAWNRSARDLRASHRASAPAGKNEPGLGFRCALQAAD